MNDNPVLAPFYLLKGLRLITRPRLRRFVLVPLAVNVLLFAGVLYYAWSQIGAWSDQLVAYLPGWLDWLSFVLVPLMVVVGLLVVFFTFTMVANLIASPFNGLLAEAVEHHLRGETFTLPPGRTLMRDMSAAFGSELRKLLYFAPRAIGLLILFIIPVLNVAAPFLWLLFSAWMLGLSYLDYPMGNHGLTFPEQRERARGRRFSVLGFGAVVSAVSVIPILNLIVMPAAVAGATALWVDRFAGQADTPAAAN